MLLSIVLEHVNPHTDSLMNVIASSASNRTFNLKFEVSSNVTETPNTVPSQRKIVLSLRKKFHSQLGNGAEVVLDKVSFFFLTTNSNPKPALNPSTGFFLAMGILSESASNRHGAAATVASQKGGVHLQ
jgi:hypothetical protein